MMFAWRGFRFTAWIAIIAVLLSALAPSMARALSPPQVNAPWTEICTLGGLQVAQTSGPASGSGSGFALKPCPYCLVHAGGFVLPTALPGFIPVADAGNQLTPPADTTPHLGYCGAAAQPRGPPITS